METLNSNFQENVVAEIKLSYSHKVKPSLRPKIKCSQHASEILRENWDNDSLGFVEEFKVMLVSRCNQVIGICRVGIGGTTCVTVDLKLVFATAIKGNASSIILAHNHPSGNLKPSEQDKRLTQKLVGAGESLDVTVMDHVIFADCGYFSFADEGIL